MYPVPNLDSYQRQASDLAAKISQLNSQYVYPAPPPSIQYVDGLNGAKDYQRDMPANGKAVLMDRNEDTFFVVGKDANGVPEPILIGRNFTLEQEKSKEDSYVTKDDFEAFKNELRQMFAQNGEKK